MYMQSKSKRTEKKSLLLLFFKSFYNSNCLLLDTRTFNDTHILNILIWTQLSINVFFKKQLRFHHQIQMYQNKLNIFLFTSDFNSVKSYYNYNNTMHDLQTSQLLFKHDGSKNHFTKGCRIGLQDVGVWLQLV